MRILLLAFLLQSAVVCTYGQQTYPYKVYDFSSIDPAKVDNDRLNQQLDSIYRTSGADSLAQLRQYVWSRQESPRYAAFIVGYQRDRASLTDLNTGLQSSGFSALSENFNGIPFGFEARGKRFAGAWLVTVGLKNSVENNDYAVKADGANMQLWIGYDVLNLKRLHLYPQVTAALQGFNIKVERKGATDITDVGDLFSNSTSTTTKLYRDSFDLGYGVELDYRLIYGHSGGLILGVRYGQSVAVAKGKFEINDDKSSFKLDDRLNESFFQVVLKIYGKN